MTVSPNKLAGGEDETRKNTFIDENTLLSFFRNRRSYSRLFPSSLSATETPGVFGVSCVSYNNLCRDQFTGVTSPGKLRGVERRTGRVFDLSVPTRSSHGLPDLRECFETSG